MEEEEEESEEEEEDDMSMSEDEKKEESEEEEKNRGAKYNSELDSANTATTLMRDSTAKHQREPPRNVTRHWNSVVLLGDELQHEFEGSELDSALLCFIRNDVSYIWQERIWIN